MDGQDRRTAKSLLEYWQLWLVLLGGAVMGIRFYYAVGDILVEQKAFKATVEDRRTKNHDDMEAVRTRLTKLETDLEWFKYVSKNGDRR